MGCEIVFSFSKVGKTIRVPLLRVKDIQGVYYVYCHSYHRNLHEVLSRGLSIPSAVPSSSFYCATDRNAERGVTMFFDVVVFIDAHFLELEANPNHRKSSSSH